ncbi:MAG TPA: MoxR family ATPase [Candidatus Aenigmarchaeota archaeon]|nr:MAG: ATPase [Candidatus Aenigmarchaeota archaeon]HDD46037.1 MoxR family ATPase [Candidatus Aenigmarchaeota archaeon]
MNREIKRLNMKAEKYAEKLEKVMEEVSKVIVGQQEVMERLIIALIADGHVLLEGVPGLAKTLMIKTLADTLNAAFRRIQFTPDLLPADIMGTKIYNHRDMKFTTQKGPIFANFILADEINRAPPKTQAAMLEAMQERQVTIQGDTFALPKPFFVMATQNPIESSGTYPLPEAQVDRFMFKTLIGYPSKEEEKVIIDRMTEGVEIEVKKVMDIKELVEIQNFVQKIYADEKIKEYVASIVDASRKPGEYGIEVDGYIEYGASPRASIWLILAAKAHALLNARGYVLPEDIKAIARDVLRHRIILTYEAEAEDVSVDSIIDKILERVKTP